MLPRVDKRYNMLDAVVIFDMRAYIVIVSTSKV